jgi:Amt family ammonium transporter
VLFGVDWYSDYIAHLDGYTVIDGGWLNKNWVQLGYQIADSVAGGAYSFVGTCIILAALDFIGKFLPVFRLRVSEDEEGLGIDDVEIGEFAVSLLDCVFFSVSGLLMHPTV